jgi:eukaryotic translation initiation factor 2C
VAVKMEPNQNHPFNKRSFYIPDGRKDIGGGIELWRGIFQSVRPTVDRLIVNIDLSTGMMYKEGPLLNLCIDFFGRAPNTSPDTILTAGTIRDIERHRLQRFLSGIRVTVSTTGDKERVIRGLSKEGADGLTFKTQAGDQMTVAQYFQTLVRPVQYPGVLCALVRLLSSSPPSIQALTNYFISGRADCHGTFGVLHGSKGTIYAQGNSRRQGQKCLRIFN